LLGGLDGLDHSKKLNAFYKGILWYAKDEMAVM